MSADPVVPDWLPAALETFYQDGLVVIPLALPVALSNALYLEAGQSNLQPAGVGRGQHLQQNLQIRRDSTCWFNGESAAQQQYLQLMAEIQQQMNRRCFLGLTHYECHFARYQQGDFYQKHLDAFKGRSNRVLTSVCYLNTVERGGALQIYSSDELPLLRVQPTAGTLVLFESERFPHEVLPAETERFSIAGWFRKD